jgi:hypothetical protein
MKFLGVELGQFACFERQFVGMQLGLNLFVGKTIRAIPRSLGLNEIIDRLDVLASA